MKRLAPMVLVVSLTAGLGVSAQLAYYIDERGRRVYINADPPPPKRKSAKTKNRHRSSVLVRQNPRTGELVEVPPPPGRPAAAQNQKPEEARPVAPTTPPAAPALTAENSPPVRMPAPDMESLIQKTAGRHDVDADLVRAIIQVESNFNPLAVSHKGALGLMQLVPGTARRFGVANVFDPVENVEGGVRYLKHLLAMYGGDLRLSLAAYNAGEKAVERHGGVPPYLETRQYVKKISALYSSGWSLFSRNRPERNRWGIVKYVDENGRLHFTNVDMP